MCKFPARQLLQLSHQAAALADASADPAMLTYACGFIKAVGDAGRFHEDLTGCECWYEAGIEANRVRRGFEVRAERWGEFENRYEQEN